MQIQTNSYNSSHYKLQKQSDLPATKPFAAFESPSLSTDVLDTKSKDTEELPFLQKVENFFSHKKHWKILGSLVIIIAALIIGDKYSSWDDLLQ